MQNSSSCGGGKAGVLWATKPFPLALNRGTISESDFKSQRFVMQRNSVEVIAVRPKPARRRVNSYVKQMIFAAAVVLCAAAVAGAQTVTTLYNFVGGKKSGANPWYVTLVQAPKREPIFSDLRHEWNSCPSRTASNRSFSATSEAAPFPDVIQERTGAGDGI
jgi:hypothetical protein